MFKNLEKASFLYIFQWAFNYSYERLFVWAKYYTELYNFKKNVIKLLTEMIQLVKNKKDLIKDIHCL